MKNIKTYREALKESMYEEDDFDNAVDAVQRGSRMSLEIMADEGFDLLSKDKSGRTLLHYAAEEDDPRVVPIIDFLVDSGIDVDVLDGRGATPLVWAVSGGSIPSTKRLIDLKADIEAVDSNFNTPLHLAAELGQTDIIKVLIEAGAEVDPKNSTGDTPLHSAILSEEPDAVKLLIDSGADVNEKTYEGLTPLYMAFHARNNVPMIKMLINAGADTRRISKDYDYKMIIDVFKNDVSWILPYIDDEDVARKIRRTVRSKQAFGL